MDPQRAGVAGLRGCWERGGGGAVEEGDIEDCIKAT